MKAIVKTRRAPGIEVLDMPQPEVGPTDILVQVAAGSLCGSDVHAYEWTPSYYFMTPPLILGHEFSGKVVTVGSEVTHIQEGDRVSAIPAMACGSCANCRTGRSSACIRQLFPGMMSHGFFAEYGRLTTAADIFKLPNNISYEAAALLEPFSVSLNAVDISGFKIGQKIAVLGPGPIGLFVTQILRGAGAATIMTVGANGDGERLKMAQQIGADFSVDITMDDPVKRAKEISPNGLDLVFEATGNPHSVSQALEMIKNGGKVILIGIHSGPASFDPTPFVRSSKSIIGAYGYTVDTWHRALNLFSNGNIDPKRVISHRLALNEANEGFKLALRKEAVKVLFMP